MSTSLHSSQSLMYKKNIKPSLSGTVVVVVRHTCSNSGDLPRLVSGKECLSRWHETSRTTWWLPHSYLSKSPPSSSSFMLLEINHHHGHSFWKHCTFARIIC